MEMTDWEVRGNIGWESKENRSVGWGSEEMGT